MMGGWVGPHVICVGGWGVVHVVYMCTRFHCLDGSSKHTGGPGLVREEGDGVGQARVGALPHGLLRQERHAPRHAPQHLVIGGWVEDRWGGER